MINQQEKLKLLRSARVSPELALMQYFEVMGTEITALLSAKFAEIQKKEDEEHAAILKQIGAISAMAGRSIEGIRASVEEINRRILDEGKIADAVSERVKIPVIRDGHTPTKEEMISLIAPLIPTSVPSSEIETMIRKLMPKIESPKPVSEDDMAALIESVVREVMTRDGKSDGVLEEKVKQLEEQIRALMNLPRTPKAKGGKYLHGGGQFLGTQEKSTTVPNGVQQTFLFAHAPGIISWNGQLQALNDDYSILGMGIIFSGSLVPVAGDKIINIYG